MRRRSENIDLDNLIVVGAELISDKAPKTTVGKVLRWLKKIVRLKTLLNIKISKTP